MQNVFPENIYIYNKYESDSGGRCYRISYFLEVNYHEGKRNQSIESRAPFDLIVTDMHYPLAKGMEADYDAGFILIERLKKEEINIPVIICSSSNYTEPGILGTVWYNELCDLNRDFRELLNKLVDGRN